VNETRTTERQETWAGYTTLETMCCPVCGVLYAVPEIMLDKARKDPEQWWYCANGHHLHFPGETEEKKLRRRLQRETELAGRLAAERDQAQAEARAQKAAKTRIKNDRDRERKRIAHGVCPCCNRSFKNLKRHMESQHPDHAHAEA
jgi:Asp-tRNA(Asn)/Glu-tRNA(Gln) amidotransferase A subunit family amidase